MIPYNYRRELIVVSQACNSRAVLHYVGVFSLPEPPCLFCLSRNFFQRANCWSLFGAGSSSFFSQKQNQSTSPSCTVIRSDGLTGSCFASAKAINSTGFPNLNRPAYHSQSFKRLSFRKLSMRTGVRTLAKLKLGEFFNQASIPLPNGSPPLIFS